MAKRKARSAKRQSKVRTSSKRSAATPAAKPAKHPAKPAETPAKPARTKRTARKRRAVRSSSSRRPANILDDVIVDADVTPQLAADSTASESRRDDGWVFEDEGFSGGRGADHLDATAIARLRAHVVHLQYGRLGGGGQYTSTREDVEALVREHLRSWIASRPAKTPARIVISAASGLAGEEEALRLARHQSGWWLANGVYPIHLVWHTGLQETIGQLLQSASDQAFGGPERNGSASDPVLETASRLLGGAVLWSGVQRSAERSCDADGGGRFLLELLKSECARSRRAVDLHLVGHSAGTIAQAHLLRAFAGLNMPPARTLALLAPAISIAEFRRRVVTLVGGAVKRVTLFALARDLERADHCGLYRKSLLHLVRSSLEEDVGTEVLGLEESVRRSGDVARVFGLAGASGAAGEAFFAGTAPGITEARSHDGFAEDVATMNSVLRRVLGSVDAPLVAYRPSPALGSRTLESRVEEELDRRGFDVSIFRPRLPAAISEVIVDVVRTAPPSSAPPVVKSDVIVEVNDQVPIRDVVDGRREATFDAVRAPLPEPPPAMVAPFVLAPKGRRYALAIGIDRYASHPLTGCVRDAKRFGEAMESLGFEVRDPVLDTRASRMGMLAAITSVLADARSGDVVALHIAGHGTTVPTARAEDGQETAIVPFDFEAGAFVTGEDLAEMFRSTADGVHVTCFLDCCHAGSLQCLWDATLPGSSGTASKARARSIMLSDAQKGRHIAFRRRLQESTDPVPQDALDVRAATEIFITACRASEIAWEVDGQGLFTGACIDVLRGGAIDVSGGSSNESFLTSLRAAMPAQAKQRPQLHCVESLRRMPFLTARMLTR